VDRWVKDLYKRIHGVLGLLHGALPVTIFEELVVLEIGQVIRPQRILRRNKKEKREN